MFDHFNDKDLIVLWNALSDYVTRLRTFDESGIVMSVEEFYACNPSRGLREQHDRAFVMLGYVKTECARRSYT